MNRHFGRILMILALVILVVCLPGQAARGGQAGPSVSENDHDARVNDSPPAAASASTEPAGNTPGIGTGSGVSSKSPVKARPGVITAGNARDSLSETHKNSQAGNTPPESVPSVPRGDASGRSDVSNYGRAAVAGIAGYSQGGGGVNSAGIRDTARNTGSPQNTAGKNEQGISDIPGGSGEPGRLAEMMGSPGGVFVARSLSVTGTSPAAGQGAGHGPSPHRQQHGPPAHSTGYPCGPAQASQLPPAPAQTRDVSKEETSPRQRSKRMGPLSMIPEPVVPVPAASTLPLQPLFPFDMLLLGGFRRISKKNVLEHDARNVIYLAISATPGIDVKTLSGMTGINENTLRYHLDRLAATGKINSLTRPGVVRYFQNQGAFGHFEHRIFHYLWTGTPHAILRLLHRNPGLTRQQIADALMIAGPSVTRQMDNLIDDGIVENRFPGRSNHYYLTAEAGLFLNKLVSHGLTMPDTIEAMPVPVSAG